MKETMFDILVYLFENYFEADIHPDQGKLARELSAAGFESKEINQAFDWFSGLEGLAQHVYPASLADSTSVRCYAEAEQAKVDAEARGFLTFLESSGVLNPIQREWVLDRILALNEAEVSLEQVKWIVLMVLWSQGQDYVFMEDLLIGDVDPLMH